MSENRHMFKGVFRNGVIVPTIDFDMPDGAEVEFKINYFEFAPAEQVEFEMWATLGAEAWAMIDEWEAEEEILEPHHRTV